MCLICHRGADIKKADKFTHENIWVKRPGTGDFTAEEYADYMSRKEALPKAAFQYGVKMTEGVYLLCVLFLIALRQ